MPGLQIIITKAGRAALVNAEHNGTAPLKITEIGITAAVFTANDDATTLPGEIKRLSTISGEVVAPDTMHVTIRDDGSDTYIVRGIGYWLSNGVLLGVYSQPDPILQKSTQSMMLLAADAVFTTIKATALAFGDANFTNPPATVERQGVVELATAAETISGKDATRAVTPAGLTSAVAKAMTDHRAEADPHQAYLTADRANSLYFRKLQAVTSSDTDCDTLLDTGVRDVSVANDRGVIAATRLPAGADGYGSLTTVNGGQFVHQVYTEATIAHRTWQRTGYLGTNKPFEGHDWKLLWDSRTFDPAAKQDKLNYTPVQQGTGIGQSPNTVKIGAAGDQLKATVDKLDLGSFVFQSGLDAVLKSYLSLAGGSVSGQLQVSGSIGAIGSDGPGRPTIEVMSKDKTDHAYMTFHRPGMFATHFGLDGNNDLAVGGYSMGANAYKLWHAGNFNPGAKQDMLGYNPVQQGTGIGQTSNAIKIGWSNGSGVKVTVDATDMGSVVFGSHRTRLNWNGIGGQPTWMFGGNTPDDVNVYNPSNFNVNYANSANYASNAGTASYATQLTGQGLVHGGIGGYHLNKNHTNSEVGGAWELRGYAYDFGSGGDGGMGTRTALWQRVA